MNNIQLRFYLCGIPTFIVTAVLCSLIGVYNNLLLNGIFYIIGYYIIPFQIFDIVCIGPYDVSFYSPFKIIYKKIKYNLFYRRY